MNDPLSGTGEAHQGGFHVLMGGGAAKFITKVIDPSLFGALLTHQGGEPVNGL